MTQSTKFQTVFCSVCKRDTTWCRMECLSCHTVKPNEPANKTRSFWSDGQEKRAKQMREAK